MAIGEFCPQCGRAREGALRFCRGCGLDLDAPVTSGTPVTPVATATPAASGWVQQAPSKPVNTGRRAKWAAAVLVITGLLDLAFAYLIQHVGQILNRVDATISSAGGLQPSAEASYGGLVVVSLLVAVAAIAIAVALFRRPTAFALGLAVAVAGAEVLVGLFVIASVGSVGPIELVLMFVPPAIAGFLAYSARTSYAVR